jgi:hypothetical protein
MHDAIIDQAERRWPGSRRKGYWGWRRGSPHRRDGGTGTGPGWQAICLFLLIIGVIIAIGIITSR